MEVTPMQYIGSAKIDDWRYRSEEDKIVTLFFKTQWVYGSAKANDDLKDLEWFPVKELGNMMENGQIAKEHHVLIGLLLKSMKA
jgi:bifunctional NMN adenylyltransferase/nudix hydrolase